MLRNMNSRHSKVTDWGLARAQVGKHDTILDIGCGGGRTVSKLASLGEGKVYGIDHSKDSVTVATRTNQPWIKAGRVEIREGSVSHLPFPASVFDLVTAVETHFWWPDLPGDMREVFRVLKPGGTLLVIAEVYRGADTMTARMVEKHLPMTGMKFLTVAEHRDLLANAGFMDVQVTTEAAKGWISALGKKPTSSIHGA